MLNVLLGCNFDFFSGQLVVTACYLVVTAHYLVVTACYWWLLLLTTCYCSLPFLVWMVKLCICWIRDVPCAFNFAIKYIILISLPNIFLKWINPYFRVITASMQVIYTITLSSHTLKINNETFIFLISQLNYNT